MEAMGSDHANSLTGIKKSAKNAATSALYRSFWPGFGEPGQGNYSGPGVRTHICVPERAF